MTNRRLATRLVLLAAAQLIVLAAAAIVIFYFTAPHHPHGGPPGAMHHPPHDEPPLARSFGPLITLVAGFVVLVIGAVLTARWIVRPIEKLSRTTRAIGEGDLGARARGRPR
jgi:methyl-accepting chemotaxis protein